MSQFAAVDCLHSCWLKDKTICQRVDEGGRLIKAVDGSGVVEASEEDCVENRGFLEPYMVRQQAAQSLDIPDLESLKAQLHSLHICRANARLKGSKKMPKALMEATLEMVKTNSHLDGKSLKRLLSYARHRYLKDQTVREAFLQQVIYKSVHICCM